MGLLGRFGAPWVNHHHGATRVVFDGFEHIACVNNAVGLVRIAANEHHVVGVFYVFHGVAVLGTKQAAIHPKVARFFLRQRAVNKAAFHGR